jgi:ribosome-associated translation inhibitor RaiA
VEEFVEFPIEYQTEAHGLGDGLRAEAEQRLLDLTTNQTDMTGASIAVDVAADKATPIYRARIVIKMRGPDVVASKEDESAENALRGALEAVERQVREQRRKFNQAWKRPDIDDQVTGENL